MENYIYFSESSLVLDSGATVPDGFQKNIEFTESGGMKCFFFTNEAPDMKWQEYEVECFDTPIPTTDNRG